ncbi:DUF2570 domain-containing protein [Stutzerimonas zhaodongensis]|uniref:DUF2570 domain-containing protein n=1 Tax=Stutzerimonas zhaodongensis TaxID=1176257 RepID=A0A3M2HQK0_9GAMM|nr:Rz-like lysis system protein LysB [Stutzerimonas zhaodongensis]MCQ4314483.1 Rz-like lysis system protein LysB [Stutzerimonas zhaodongensis]RMH92001.1 DUF2570 domain-containing protein [Stutzerimonas zhaodongensis]
MTSWKVWLAIASVFIAMALALNFQAQRIDAEAARADLATERQQKLEQRNERQAATIIRLGGEVAAQRADQLSLQQTTSDLHQAHATDQLKKKDRQRHDPPLQNWADQPLPDAARRLHQRPAITGAAGYRQWLSGRDALHAQPGSPVQ